MKIHKYLVIVCLPIVFLTGCWDAINIEDRGFIVGTAIDIEEFKDGEPIFSVTNQIVISKGFANLAEGGSDDQQAFLNLTTKGHSIYRTNEELSGKSSKVPYYEHLRILIISEKIAKTEHLLNELLDRYVRDPKIRRGIKIFITKNDEGKKLLDFQTTEDKLPSIHMDELVEHSTNEVGFLKPLTLGDIEEFHFRNRSYVLPQLSLDDTIQRKSGAVFQGPKEKMVGNLNASELQGLELYQGNAKEKVIDFKYKDRTFTFETTRMKSRPKIDTSNPNDIHVHLRINMVGIIKESYSKENFLTQEAVDDVEKAVSDKVKKSVQKTIDKAQNELNADVFKVWQQLQTKHYDTWKKVRNNWEKGENYFANNVTFHIDVNTDVYSIGTSNRTR